MNTQDLEVCRFLWPEKFPAEATPINQEDEE